MIDVLMNIVAFERINEVRIEVRMSAEEHHGKADMRIACLAHSKETPIGDQPPLASVSVTCLDTNLKSLDAALIHALYMLDGQLAENELEGAKPK